MLITELSLRIKFGVFLQWWINKPRLFCLIADEEGMDGERNKFYYLVIFTNFILI